MYLSQRRKYKTYKMREREGEVLLQNVLVSHCKMHLSQITTCICLRKQNVFVSNKKNDKRREGGRGGIIKCICLKLQNIFVPDCKMFLSQIAKWIFPDCKMYLLQMANYICLKEEKIRMIKGEREGGSGCQPQ